MKLLYGVDVIEGLKTLKDESVNCCVTSPPYFGLRDYGCTGQIGLEATPQEFVEKMVEVFREVRRVLTKDGTLWINLGDSYWNNYGGGSDTCTTGNHEALKQRGRSNKPKSDIYKIKDLIGIPWAVANALREPMFKCAYCGAERRYSVWPKWDNGFFLICGSCGRRCKKQPERVSNGWYLRQDIIWHKPNPMPESVTDRCTKAHEYVFFLSKSAKYFFDAKSIKEPSIYKKPPAVPVGWDTGKGSHRELKGRYRNSALKGTFNGKTEEMADTGQNAFRAIVETRNKRSVWTVNTKPYKGAHFATFPTALIAPMISAGCPQGGVVLDPFSGSGTTGEVALKLGRHYIGIDLNKEYEKLARERIGLFL